MSIVCIAAIEWLVDKLHLAVVDAANDEFVHSPPFEIDLIEGRLIQ